VVRSLRDDTFLYKKLMKSVLVLLSTYNGEKFLREQLDSLYAQEGVEMNLLVRDDGSKDSTFSILEEYKSKYGRMDIIKGQNVGAGPSFLELIKIAMSDYSTYEYYAFCDQDDVWFAHKIESGVRALEGSNKKLKMYFSGSVNTDAELNPINPSHVRLVNSFGANLVANHIIGCSMMFNKALLEEINKINTRPFKIPNGNIPIHDAWAAIVAYGLGAEVIQSNASMMYYRQHGNNTIGAGHGFLSIQWHRITRYLKTATHGKANKCIIALQVLDDIPERNKQFLELVACYRSNLWRKIQLMTDRRMYEYSLVDNIGTFLTLLFNKF